MSKSANNALDKIARRGQSVRGPGFVIYYNRIFKPSTPRIVISGKVDKRAVIRNKLRRQIKNIIDDANFSNIGLVVIVNKEILGFGFQALKQNFQKAFKKI